MTQFFTDFSEYATGYIPNDWTIKLTHSGTTWVVEDDATATGGKVLKIIEPASSEYNILSWNVVGSVTDAEIVVRAKTINASNGNIARLWTRFSGTESSKFGYVGQANTFTTGISKYTGGSGVSIGTNNSFTKPANNQWYWIRFKINFKQVLIKAWKDGELEPSTWFSVNDTSISNSGYIGIGRSSGSSASGITYFDLVGIGTNGDIAPIGPIVSYPICTILSVDKTKISGESGMNISNVNFSFNIDVQAWTVNVGGTSHDTGFVAAFGGSVVSGSQIAAEIDWTELQLEGENRVNIYGQSLNGAWTAYGIE